MPELNPYEPGAQPPAPESVQFVRGAAQPAPEVPEQTRCFEGTDVPELSIVQDEGWLKAILPSRVIFGPGVLVILNEDAAIAEGNPLRRGAGAVQTSRYSSPVYGKLSRNELAATARRHFYQTIIGGPIPTTARNGIEVAARQAHDPNVRPLRAIAISRILHELADEHFDEVVVTARELYRMSPAMLRRRVELLKENGIDPRAILLGTPTAYKRRSDDDTAFLAAARKAEEKYRQKLAAVAAGTSAIILPKVTRSERPAGANIRRRKQYKALANVTGLSVGALYTTFPQLDELPPRHFEYLVTRVRWAFEDAATVRIEDVARFMPPAEGEE